MKNSIFHVGNTEIVKVTDTSLDGFTAAQLLPGFDPDMQIQDPRLVDPKLYDAKTGRVSLSVHTWVVWHQGKILLIDTGAGNDKSRPQLKVLDHLSNPYLDRLREVGVHPDQVDYVLLTHIHADHVGWNTAWDGTKWAPTFPNATVICSDREFRYSATLGDAAEELVAEIRSEADLGESVRVPTPGVFADSMAPVEAAGKLRRIAIDGSEVLKGIRFLPTPGHSIDHASISISSGGHEAVFGGDVIHHPFELHDLNLVSMFCEFPEAARSSRRRLVRHIVERNALYFSSHIPYTSAGKITEAEVGYNWTFFHPDGELGRG